MQASAWSSHFIHVLCSGTSFTILFKLFSLYNLKFCAFMLIELPCRFSFSFRPDFSALQKRKRDTYKELETNQTVNAQIEIMKEDYLASFVSLFSLILFFWNDVFCLCWIITIVIQKNFQWAIELTLLHNAFCFKFLKLFGYFWHFIVRPTINYILFQNCICVALHFCFSFCIKLCNCSVFYKSYHGSKIGMQQDWR